MTTTSSFISTSLALAVPPAAALRTSVLSLGRCWRNHPPRPAASRQGTPGSIHGYCDGRRERRAGAPLGLSLVSEHADHNTVWVANEETTNAPGLVDRTVDHLVSTPHRFGVRGIYRRPRAHVDAHVGQGGLNA